MPSELRGAIFQINISKGGVPKLGVRSAELDALGVKGDEHRDLEHHGGPERAVCLYSLEHIQALQAEGHPIFPGSVGENLTVSGLDWQQVTPGARLRVGEQALLEVTQYTVPCSNIRASFSGEEIGRILQSKFPGWSRVYAKVLQGGAIRVGDRVVLEQG